MPKLDEDHHRPQLKKNREPAAETHHALELRSAA
jgi:hypothetical protein